MPVDAQTVASGLSFWPATAVQWSQFASNIGSAGATITAIVALGLVSAKTLESQWNDNFRKLYDEFWKDPSIADARRFIAYDQEYEKIKNVLRDMALSPHIMGDLTSSITVKKPRPNHFDGAAAAQKREFSRHEIDATEKIDQFCAKCLQLVFTSDIIWFKRRQTEFKHLFFHFWVDAINARPELGMYIEKFWPSLANQITAQEPIRPQKRQ